MAPPDSPGDAGRDYRETVFLPETPFPMRAGLPKKEPEILGQWAEQDLYKTLRKTRQAAGAPLYALHDGPPYANGAIHIGHCLQKTLKDFVVRSRFLLGYDVDYLPGWDCHGLPIEWKVEEDLRAKGRRKDDVSKAEFRARCREEADRWIGIQMEGFKRLGVLGDWERRYSTMDYSSEAALIVAEFHKFLMLRGPALSRLQAGHVEPESNARRSLDAEIEHYDQRVSPTVWVKFPLAVWPDPKFESAHGVDLAGASVVIWTTTPWTIPANRAVSYGPEINYGAYEIEEFEPDLPFQPWARVGEILIVADKLAD